MLGYITVREMAQRTGLSEERIRQLIRTHEIRSAVKLGGWLVKAEDFEAFIKTRTYGPPQDTDRTDEEPPARRKAG